MPPERLPRKVLDARPTGRRPRGRPKTRWRDYISKLAWERLGILPEGVEEVAWDNEIWKSQLELLPPRPDSGYAVEDGWERMRRAIYQSGREGLKMCLKRCIRVIFIKKLLL